MVKPTVSATWALLNERQQGYLRTLYTADQVSEQLEKDRRAEGYEPRPAETWRRMEYGMVGGHSGRLQKLLDGAGIWDQGAGSTLAILVEHNLIKQYRTPENPDEGEQYFLRIEVTPRGRLVARAGGADGAGPAKPPRGLLSEWLWTVLVSMWQAGDAGVPSYARGSAWAYLEQRKDGSYVAYSNAGGGTYTITDRGREHYRQHFATYARAYPQVSAPPPDGSGIAPWPQAVDRDLRCHAAAASHADTALADVHRALAAAETTVRANAPDEDPPPVPEPVGEDTVAGLAHARAILAREHACRLSAVTRDNAEEMAALLREQIPALVDGYRRAAARYLAAALAVAQAVIDDGDPQAALTTAVPVDLDAAGRPTAPLPLLVTGLVGVDDAYVALHAVAAGFRVKGKKAPRRPSAPRRALRTDTDRAAADHFRYAARVHELVRGGELQRLLLRLAPAAPAAG